MQGRVVVIRSEGRGVAQVRQCGIVFAHGCKVKAAPHPCVMVFGSQFGSTAVIGQSSVHIARVATLFGEFYLLGCQSEQNLALSVDFGFEAFDAPLEFAYIAQFAAGQAHYRRITDAFGAQIYGFECLFEGVGQAMFVESQQRFVV